MTQLQVEVGFISESIHRKHLGNDGNEFWLLINVSYPKRSFKVLQRNVKVFLSLTFQTFFRQTTELFKVTQTSICDGYIISDPVIYNSRFY